MAGSSLQTNHKSIILVSRGCSWRQNPSPTDPWASPRALLSARPQLLRPQAMKRNAKAAGANSTLSPNCFLLGDFSWARLGFMLLGFSSKLELAYFKTEMSSRAHYKHTVVHHKHQATLLHQEMRPTGPCPP